MRFHRPVVVVCLLAVGCSIFAPPISTPNMLPSASAAAQETLPPASTAPENPAAATANPGWWRPPANASWQWQLSGGAIDTSFDADVYDLDAFETSAELVASLHRRGRRVVCYISAGSWEDWRPDAGDFPDEVIGSEYEGWEGERWLDVRRIDLLAPVLTARMDMCKAKGFDAVEPDNIDGYLNETGFPIRYEDQLAFNRFLARQAHARGLAVGLKNDADQAEDLLPDFDFALLEDCFDQGWCEQLLPFLRSGKPVLDAEYTDTGITLDEFCPQAKALGIQAILKHRELDAWRQACP